jgi:hypothetical protein
VPAGTYQNSLPGGVGAPEWTNPEWSEGTGPFIEGFGAGAQHAAIDQAQGAISELPDLGQQELLESQKSDIPQVANETGFLGWFIGYVLTTATILMASAKIMGKNPKKPPPADVAREIADTLPNDVKKFGKCMDFADKLSTALKKKGVNGTIIRLEKQGATIGDIRGKGTLVGHDVHEAVRVGDTVFDNLNPKGVPYAQWRESLRFLNNPSSRIPEQFFTPRGF